MMNDFENNDNVNNNSENDPKEIRFGAEPQNNQPNTDNRTYQSTYTPGESGYTRKTSGPQDFSSYNYNANPRYSTGYSQTPPPKKTSKAGIVAMIICGFIVIAISFSLIGFGIASMSAISNNEQVIAGNDTEKTDESIETEIDKSTESDSLPSDTESTGADGNTATITKTPGGTVVTVEGKVGELMSKHQAVALVKDSVVEITTEQVVNGNRFYQYVQSGAGSGVIVAEEGYVITNNHVISGASKITVRLTNGNEYEAKLIGTDASTDIAVLKITPTEKLTVAVLGSSEKLSIAEEVIVIGNPLGKLGGTVTNGIVSALAREITIEGENMTLIQTNAAVNPGNSGGGMFNLYGELVGIVNAKSSGSDVEGLGFAIPIDTAYDIMLQLMDYGYVRGRVDHGLQLIDINDLFTAASYRVNSLGVYVYESKYTDEIKNGDRIASINGKEVSTSAGVKEALNGCSVGDTVDVTVARGGRFVDVKLTLKEYVPENTGEVSFE